MIEEKIFIVLSSFGNASWNCCMVPDNECYFGMKFAIIDSQNVKLYEFADTHKMSSFLLMVW
jgi:hypothetical protein